MADNIKPQKLELSVEKHSSYHGPGIMYVHVHTYVHGTHFSEQSELTLDDDSLKDFKVKLHYGYTSIRRKFAC